MMWGTKKIQPVTLEGKREVARKLVFEHNTCVGSDEEAQARRSSKIAWNEELGEEDAALALGTGDGGMEKQTKKKSTMSTVRKATRRKLGIKLKKELEAGKLSQLADGHSCKQCSDEAREKSEKLETGEENVAENDDDAKVSLPDTPEAKFGNVPKRLDQAPDSFCRGG